MDAMKFDSSPLPYYPLNKNIVFETNEYHFTTLLLIFAAGCIVIFTATTLAVKTVQPRIPTSELLTILWFVLSGCIHLFFEGYFVYNFRNLANKQHVFAQLWKEYSYSDSRYLTRDPFVLCMETITAVFWGPLSFITAYTIAKSHPLRHPLQIIISIGQLYGDVLYYATSLVDHYMLGISYSRPEGFYFWFYFVGMNMFWIVIPGWLIWRSVIATRRAFEVLGRTGGEGKKTS